MNAPMTVQVGDQVRVQQEQKSAPFNGAIGTVVAVVADAERHYAVVELHGREYRFSGLDLVVVG